MVTVIFKNFGRTPVWLVEASIKLICEFRKPVEFPPVLSYDPPFVFPNSELVPPQRRPIPRGIELRYFTDQDIEDIKFGKQLLLIYGLIRYRDVFFEQTNILRETYFCKRYMFLGTEGDHWVDFGQKGSNRTS